ncbi:MAG: ABC transporter permease [Nocardioidaceae bacterium]
MAPVLGFIGKRVAFGILQIIGVALGTFVLLRALPPDPVAGMIGTNPSPDARRLASEALGLDKSLGGQLVEYAKGVAHGSFGTSWKDSTAVLPQVLDHLAVTLQFVVPAFLLALLISVPLGLYVASRPGSRLDRWVFGYSLFAGAQPEFWWGLIFVYVFFFKLQVLPAPLGLMDPIYVAPPEVTHFPLLDAIIAGQPDAAGNIAGHLVLPVVTLAFVLSGPMTKMTRQSAEAVFGSDYILYARACGFPQGKVRRQMLRIAVSPVLTLVGILFGFMLGGAVLLENVFSMPGLGQLALNATLNLDYPVIQGSVIVMTAIALTVFIVMDIAHALLDPRVALDA